VAAKIRPQESGSAPPCFAARLIENPRDLTKKDCAWLAGTMLWVNFNFPTSSLYLCGAFSGAGAETVRSVTLKEIEVE
jgi:hypothetical protein